MGWSRVQNGAFVPQCRADGRYDAVQCYKGTCWCVDEYGYELPSTRVKSDTPDCNEKPGGFLHYCHDLKRFWIQFFKVGIIWYNRQKI